MMLQKTRTEKLQALFHQGEQQVVQRVRSMNLIWVLLGVAVLFGVLLAKQTVVGLSLLGTLIGLFTIVLCLVSVEAAIVINIAYCFFSFGIARYFFGDSFPVGVGTDVLILTAFVSLLIHKPYARKSFSSFVQFSAVIMIFTVVGFLAIEIFNPEGHSFGGWFQTFRRFLESIILLFTCYALFTERRQMHLYIKTLFILATLSGLYGCFQHWHGLMDFEIAWVMATENRFGLIFINGDYRKFSMMSDPTAYGLAMSGAAIFFIILALHEKKAKYRWIYLAGVLFMLLGMAYSGTRTANAVLIGGLALYVLLRFNKASTRFFALIGALVFLTVLYAPIYSNKTINRFRSSFTSTEEDESFKVRSVNRKMIQPYIYTHPIGWGLGTTGAQGLQYNPHHFLAGFPPDSGYLKKALETGYIGLFLAMLMYFVITRTGIRGYFHTPLERRKTLYAAATATLFSFYLAEFAQEAIGQISDMVIYYPLLAIMLRLRTKDKEEAVLQTTEDETA